MYQTGRRRFLQGLGAAACFPRWLAGIRSSSPRRARRRAQAGRGAAPPTWTRKRRSPIRSHHQRRKGHRPDSENLVGDGRGHQGRQDCSRRCQHSGIRRARCLRRRRQNRHGRFDRRARPCGDGVTTSIEADVVGIAKRNHDDRRRRIGGAANFAGLRKCVIGRARACARCSTSA